MGLFKRPGGPLKGKIIQGSDGKWYNEFGESATDEDFSREFWLQQPKGLKDVMKGEILRALQRGTFYMAVSPDGITIEDGMKLSAYRILAKEMGIEIVGLFEFKKGPNTVSAKIKKIK